MALTDKLTAIADAIRTKTGSTEKLTLDQMPTEIAGIQAGGGENLLDYANTLQNAFQGNVFDVDDIIISFGSKATEGLQSTALSKTFYRAGIKTVEICYEGSATSVIGLGNFAATISGDTRLERIAFTGGLSVIKVNDCYRAFYRRNGLRDIIVELNMTNAISTAYTSDMFTGCAALETVRFTAGSIRVSIAFTDSPNLTDETIQSIIDGLADLTDGTAQTLTLHATVGAKLTEEQKASASAKNWTISY